MVERKNSKEASFAALIRTEAALDQSLAIIQQDNADKAIKSITETGQSSVRDGYLRIINSHLTDLDSLTDHQRIMVFDAIQILRETFGSPGYIEVLDIWGENQPNQHSQE